MWRFIFIVVDRTTTKIKLSCHVTSACVTYSATYPPKRASLVGWYSRSFSSKLRTHLKSNILSVLSFIGVSCCPDLSARLHKCFFNHSRQWHWSHQLAKPLKNWQNIATAPDDAGLFSIGKCHLSEVITPKASCDVVRNRWSFRDSVCVKLQILLTAISKRFYNLLCDLRVKRLQCSV